MNKKSVTKVFSNQRKALRLSGDTHRALKVAPWLISAAAAWLTFFPAAQPLPPMTGEMTAVAPSMERFLLKIQLTPLREMKKGNSRQVGQRMVVMQRGRWN